MKTKHEYVVGYVGDSYCIYGRDGRHVAQMTWLRKQDHRDMKEFTPMTDLTLWYKFIRVCPDARREQHEGKPTYHIFDKMSGLELGRILWYAPRRRWVFTSTGDSVWSTDRLADVRDAIAKITKHHAEARP